MVWGGATHAEMVVWSEGWVEDSGWWLIKPYAGLRGHTKSIYCCYFIYFQVFFSFVPRVQHSPLALTVKFSHEERTIVPRRSMRDHVMTRIPGEHFHVYRVRQGRSDKKQIEEDL
jgi:hypothetical protein